MKDMAFMHYNANYQVEKSKSAMEVFIWLPLEPAKCMLHERYCIMHIAKKRKAKVYLGAIRAGEMCLQPAER